MRTSGFKRFATLKAPPALPSMSNVPGTYKTQPRLPIHHLLALLLVTLEASQRTWPEVQPRPKCLHGFRESHSSVWLLHHNAIA